MIQAAISVIKRNNKLFALIAVAVVLVIVAYVFYSGWQSSEDEETKVQRQLTMARQSLIVAQEQYDVASLQAQYDSLKNTATFPASFPGVDLSAYIAGAADKYGVWIDIVTPKSPTGTETLAGRQYYRYDTAVQVAGDYQSMNSFLSYLEEGPFLTARIQSASFTPTGGTITLGILTQS